MGAAHSKTLCKVTELQFVSNLWSESCKTAASWMFSLRSTSKPFWDMFVALNEVLSYIRVKFAHVRVGATEVDRPEKFARAC
eukprot:526019-Amphidinium_carterae.1